MFVKIYSLSQAGVQRYSSLPSLGKARLLVPACYWILVFHLFYISLLFIVYRFYRLNTILEITKQKCVIFNVDLIGEFKENFYLQLSLEFQD